MAAAPGDTLGLVVWAALRRCNVRRSEDGGVGLQLRGCAPVYVKRYLVLRGGPC